MNVVRLEGVVADGEVERDTGGAKHVVGLQALNKLPGNLPQTLQQRVPLLPGGDVNTAGHLGPALRSPSLSSHLTGQPVGNLSCRSESSN